MQAGSIKGAEQMKQIINALAVLVWCGGWLAVSIIFFLSI